MSAARWWRLGVVVEREGAPWTMTFHVRARTEEGARRLVHERLRDEPHAIHLVFASEPVRGIPPRDEIAAVFGPYRRSWEDRDLWGLRKTVEAARAESRDRAET